MDLTPAASSAREYEQNLVAVQWSGFLNPALNTLFMASKDVLIGNVETYWNRDADLFMFMQPEKSIWAITPRWKSNDDGTMQDLLQAAIAGKNVACAFQLSAGGDVWEEWFGEQWKPTRPQLLKLREELPSAPSQPDAMKATIGCQTPNLTPVRLVTDSSARTIEGCQTPNLTPVRVITSVDNSAFEKRNQTSKQSVAETPEEPSAHKEVNSVATRSSSGDSLSKISIEKPPRSDDNQSTMQKEGWKTSDSEKYASTNSQEAKKWRSTNWLAWECVCGFMNHRSSNDVCGGRNTRVGCGRPRPAHLTRASAEKGWTNKSWSSHSSWASQTERAWESVSNWANTSKADTRAGQWEEKGWYNYPANADDGDDKADRKEKTHKKDKKVKKDKKDKKKKKMKKDKKVQKDKKNESAQGELEHSEPERSDSSDKLAQPPLRRLTNVSFKAASKRVYSSMNPCQPQPDNQPRKSLALIALAGVLSRKHDSPVAATSSSLDTTPNAVAPRDNAIAAAATSDFTQKAVEGKDPSATTSSSLAPTPRTVADGVAATSTTAGMHDGSLDGQISVNHVTEASIQLADGNPPPVTAGASFNRRRRKPWPSQVHTKDCGCVTVDSVQCKSTSWTAKSSAVGTQIIAANSSPPRLGTNASPIPRWRL